MISNCLKEVDTEVGLGEDRSLMSEVKRKSSGLKIVHKRPLALSICTRVDKKQGENQPAKIFRKPYCQTHLKPMILSLKQISGL